MCPLLAMITVSYIIISIWETWFANILTDTFVCMAGYIVFQRDRSSRSGHVAILVRQGIHAELVSAMLVTVTLRCLVLM